MTDLLIVGAGPAGLTAALYARRSGLSVSVLDKGAYGGQIAETSEVENYPAILSITGFDFASRLYEQVKGLGTEFLFEEVIGADLKSPVKTIATATGSHQSKTVILANGAKRRKLEVEGEDTFRGRGVSYCATCDGAFFRGQDVAIVGGGNTALEDALYLSNTCRSVTLIHRRDAFRGERHLVEAVTRRENLKILYNSTVQAIQGDERVHSLSLLVDGAPRQLEVAAVFIAVGFQPDNGLYADQLPLDQTGYFVADESCTTPLKGVYVAGDCRVKPLRQIVTAASDGAVAAFQAAAYLNLHEVTSKDLH